MFLFTNRLKDVLLEVISKSQNVFVLKEIILDNSIIVFKTLHFIKRVLEGKKEKAPSSQVRVKLIIALNENL